MKIKLLQNHDWLFQCEDTILTLCPPSPVDVTDEVYEQLPEFNQNACPWAKGIPLKGVAAYECSLTGAFVAESIRVETLTGELLNAEQDYEIDSLWGLIGRLPQGRIAENEAVKISYRYYPSRMDSVFRDRSDTLSVRQGRNALATPEAPVMQEGEERLINIFYSGKCEQLTDEMIYPILEPEFSWPDEFSWAIPNKSLSMLDAGKKVKILAWGDSVTEGAYLPEKDRWQNQFVEALPSLFPQANVELQTVGWGGKTMTAYFSEPSGSIHNYCEQVLAKKPDLIISEFVNDAGLSPEEWKNNYSRCHDDFRSAGIEWIILTPHYVRPDWMGFISGKEIDEDPRPYVKFLREFAKEREVPLADASLLYGHLWKEGIPYQTMMVNGINHPDRRGMALFKDALMHLMAACKNNSNTPPMHPSLA